MVNQLVSGHANNSRVNLGQKCALITFAVDESGSMGGEHLFLQGSTQTIATTLLAANVKVYVCVNGFGANDPTPHVVDPCSEVNAGNLGSVGSRFTSLKLDGYYEDGFDGVSQAAAEGDLFLASLPSGDCDFIVKMMVLVTDEDRDVVDNSDTLPTTLTALTAGSYVTNIIVNFIEILGASDPTNTLGK